MSHFTTTLLVGLIFQRSTSSILLHEAGQDYSTGLAILLGELLKQGISLTVGLYQVHQDINLKLPSASQSNFNNTLASSLYQGHEAVKSFVSRAISKEAWKIFLPAALYVVQNNLYLYASSRLQPSTFQALWQLRLIPTAYLSQVVLEKKLGMRRWFALCIILIGVIAIQQTQTQGASPSLSETATDKRTKIMALSALTLAAIVASLAGVLLEKVFKQKETNLWIANFQLSTFSIAPAAFVLLVECGQSNSILEPFQAFGKSFWPWVAVLIQGSAGVLVALTTKYAGCIAGSISGIAAIAVTHLIEVIRGQHSDSTGEITFILGFALIAAGIRFYTVAPANESLIESISEQEYATVSTDDSSIIEMSCSSDEEKTDAPFCDDNGSMSPLPSYKQSLIIDVELYHEPKPVL